MNVMGEEFETDFWKEVSDRATWDMRSGSGNLNNGVWFYKWIPALVMPPP